MTAPAGDDGPWAVRAVGAADVNAVAAMWARLYREAEPTEAGSEGALDARGLREATLRWTREAADGEPAFALLALESATTPVGFVACTVWNRAWSRRGLIGNINALWVEPRLRRAGIGRSLAGSAMTDLRRRGAHVIEVQALAANPGAEAFWRHQGFAPKAILFRLKDR